MYGMGVDSLVSAKIVTAKGAVVVSEKENRELFWAVKGAGQYFGVVTEVTVRIFRLQDPILTWTCLFLPGQVKELGGVLEEMVNWEEDGKKRSPGMVAIMAPPGQTKVRVLISNFQS